MGMGNMMMGKMMMGKMMMDKNMMSSMMMGKMMMMMDIPIATPSLSPTSTTNVPIGPMMMMGMGMGKGKGGMATMDLTAEDSSSSRRQSPTSAPTGNPARNHSKKMEFRWKQLLHQIDQV